MTREEVIETLSYAVLFDVATITEIQDIIDDFNQGSEQAEEQLRTIIVTTSEKFSYANYATNAIIGVIGHRQFNSYVKEYGVTEAMKMAMSTLELTNEISRMV